MEVGFCLYREKYEKLFYFVVNPNRTVSLSKFSFFKPAFAFADQNLPSSAT